MDSKVPTARSLCALSLAVIAGCGGSKSSAQRSTDTSAYALGSAHLEAPAGDQTDVVTELTSESLQASPAQQINFTYDAIVVTATRTTATATVRSAVLSSSGFVNGYAYPLAASTVEEDVLQTFANVLVKDALSDGVAEISFPVEAGRQYVISYKTFASFTPLSARVAFLDGLKLEGHAMKLEAPVSVGAGESGTISLANPRPRMMKKIVEYLNDELRKL